MKWSKILVSVVLCVAGREALEVVCDIRPSSTFDLSASTMYDELQ